jgi:predicted DNA-binding transcriptional regulator YafY
MARNEQLIRQHKLLEILERYRFGRTLSELRDEVVDELGLLSLHTRSVHRDLEALQAAGIDVGTHEVPRGRVWKLGPRFRGSHRIAATATELMALSLGRDLMLPLAGTPFWSGIESFWHKIQESLPEAVYRHYEKYRRFLHVLGVPTKSYAKQQGILKSLNRSILERRVVEIRYRSMGADKAASRRIHPYAVVLYHSSLYIVADACDVADREESIRHLKLDRFEKATALDEWFEPRKDLDIQKHLQTSIGIFAGAKPKNFRIRISHLAARWVTEDPWHPNQNIQQNKDGSIVLRVTAAHELEIIPRVLALGAEAEILSPASCRKAMASTVARLAEIYAVNS